MRHPKFGITNCLLDIQCSYMDHQSAADEHTLLCILTQTYSICTDVPCTVSDRCMRSFLGNLRELGSVTWEYALILIHCVSIPYPQVQKFGNSAVSISPYHCLVMYSHQMEVESITYWWHRRRFTQPQTEYVLLHQLGLFFEHRVFCIKTILRI